MRRIASTLTAALSLAIASARAADAQEASVQGWTLVVNAVSGDPGQVRPMVVRYLIGPHQVRTDVLGFLPAIRSFITIVNAADSSIRILDLVQHTVTSARYRPAALPHSTLADVVQSWKTVDGDSTRSIAGHDVQRYELTLRDSSPIEFPLPMTCGTHFSGTADAWQTTDPAAKAALDSVATALRDLLGDGAPRPWLASAHSQIPGIPLRLRVHGSGPSGPTLTYPPFTVSVVQVARTSIPSTAFDVPAFFQPREPDLNVTANLQQQLSMLCPPMITMARSGASPPSAPTGAAYFEFQVEKPVSVLPGQGAPIYPAPLRAANITGQVLAQWVVDTTGRADMSTFRPLRSTDVLFTEAVKEWVSTARFVPAELGGRHVAQLVQMPFNFNLSP